MNPIIEALDRLNNVAACLEAVSDLAVPEPDLHIVNRDKFALLLAFLIAEHRLACNQLGDALKPGKVVNF